MRIGLLTGGGDCPGLNAAIRAVVKQGLGEYGHSIIGFRNGWKGVVDGDVLPLDFARDRHGRAVVDAAAHVGVQFGDAEPAIGDPGSEDDGARADPHPAHEDVMVGRLPG